MRETYINGGPGVVVSGFVWLMAGFVAHFISFKTGMITLFVGGALIHPVSVLISNRFKPENLDPPDPKLSRLAVLTLPLIFGGFYLAYIMSAEREAIFFAVMAIAIGIRYLVFQYIYGLKVFWILGGLLVALGVLGYLVTGLTAIHIALGVGLVELSFGFWLTRDAIK